MRLNIFLIIVFLLFPILFQNDYYIYLLTLIFIYSISAMGLNILTGLTDQISLGHAGFFAIGAYSVELFRVFFNTSFLVSFILAIILAVFLGLIIAIPALRLKGLYLAIVTLAFGLITERVIYLWTPVTGGPNGLVTSMPSIFFIDIDTDLKLYYFVFFFLIIAAWVYFSILKTIVGKRFIAIRDSEIASNATGFSSTNYKILSFILAAIFGVASGSLYGVTVGYISVDHFNFFVSVSFLAMIVVGGLGSKYGPFLGAAFVTILPELLSGFEDFQLFAYGLSIVLVFMLWKTGLAGLIEFVASLFRSKKVKSET